MNLHHRYEILVPLKGNDGVTFADSLHSETSRELLAEFGGLSWEAQAVTGEWLNEAKDIVEDDLTKVYVDAPAERKNRRFFGAFKKRLEERYKQDVIWLTSHGVDVIES